MDKKEVKEPLVDVDANAFHFQVKPHVHVDPKPLESHKDEHTGKTVVINADPYHFEVKPETVHPSDF